MTSIVEGGGKLKTKERGRELTEGLVSLFSPIAEAELWVGLLEDVIVIRLFDVVLGRGFWM